MKKTEKKTAAPKKSAVEKKKSGAKKTGYAPEADQDLSFSKEDDEELPGYPHYPAKEDIMNPENGMQKADVDEEDLSSRTSIPAGKKSKVSTTNAENKTGMTEEDLDEDELAEEAPGESDITRDDLIALGSDAINPESGSDDEPLRNRRQPVDMAAEDLDIPGSELDDANEDIGEEDEENNSYSIGGDRHDDLEENPDSR